MSDKNLETSLKITVQTDGVDSLQKLEQQLAKIKEGAEALKDAFKPYQKALEDRVSAVEKATERISKIADNEAKAKSARLDVEVEKTKQAETKKAQETEKGANARALAEERTAQKTVDALATQVKALTSLIAKITQTEEASVKALASIAVAEQRTAQAAIAANAEVEASKIQSTAAIEKITAAANASIETSNAGVAAAAIREQQRVTAATEIEVQKRLTAQERSAAKIAEINARANARSAGGSGMGAIAGMVGGMAVGHEFIETQKQAQAIHYAMLAGNNGDHKATEEDEEDLKKVFKKTGANYYESGKGAIPFIVSARKAGISGAETNKILEGFLGEATISGADALHTKNGLRTLGEMIANPKMQKRDLNNLLREVALAVPDMMEFLKKQSNGALKTDEDVLNTLAGKAASDGQIHKINARQTVRTFYGQEAPEKNAKILEERNANSIDANLNSFRQSRQEAWASMGKGGLNAEIVSVLKELSAVFADKKLQVGLRELGVTLGEVIKTIASGVRPVADFIQHHSLLIKGFIGALAVMGGLNLALKLLMTPFNLLSTSFNNLRTTAGRLTGSITTVRTAMSNTATTATNTGSAIRSNLVAALTALHINGTTVTGTTNLFKGALVTLRTALTGAIIGAKDLAVSLGKMGLKAAAGMATGYALSKAVETGETLYSIHDARKTQEKFEGKDLSKLSKEDRDSLLEARRSEYESLKTNRDSLAGKAVGYFAPEMTAKNDARMAELKDGIKFIEQYEANAEALKAKKDEAAAKKAAKDAEKIVTDADAKKETARGLVDPAAQERIKQEELLFKARKDHARLVRQDEEAKNKDDYEEKRISLEKFSQRRRELAAQEYADNAEEVMTRFDAETAELRKMRDAAKKDGKMGQVAKYNEALTTAEIRRQETLNNLVMQYLKVNDQITLQYDKQAEASKKKFAEEMRAVNHDLGKRKHPGYTADSEIDYHDIDAKFDDLAEKAKDPNSGATPADIANIGKERDAQKYDRQFQTHKDNASYQKSLDEDKLVDIELKGLAGVISKKEMEEQITKTKKENLLAEMETLAVLEKEAVSDEQRLQIAKQRLTDAKELEALKQKPEQAQSENSLKNSLQKGMEDLINGTRDKKGHRKGIFGQTGVLADMGTGLYNDINGRVTKGLASEGIDKLTKWGESATEGSDPNSVGGLMNKGLKWLVGDKTTDQKVKDMTVKADKVVVQGKGEGVAGEAGNKSAGGGGLGDLFGAVAGAAFPEAGAALEGMNLLSGGLGAISSMGGIAGIASSALGSLGGSGAASNIFQMTLNGVTDASAFNLNKNQIATDMSHATSIAASRNS